MKRAFGKPVSPAKTGFASEAEIDGPAPVPTMAGSPTVLDEGFLYVEKGALLGGFLRDISVIEWAA